MEPDAYDIPKPKDTAVFEPQMVLLPCIGYGPEGVRMGYGGGFYDRTVAALKPRPYVVGLSYSNGFLPMLRARSPDELVLDALLTDDGVVWQR
jgi:5-formyltetrahydrofolate cyclo-ligase